MLTQSSQQLIDQIKEIEFRKISFDMKFFHLHSDIMTTKKIADSNPTKKAIQGDNLEIKRNLKLDLVMWFLIALVAIFPITYVTIKQIRNFYSNPLGIIMGIGLISFLLFMAFRNLTYKKLNYPVILTDKQITIKGETYYWEEIEETFYVYRARKSYFVIGLRNGQIKYFNIGHQLGFRYSDHDFSAFVEHFKGRHYLQGGR